MIENLAGLEHRAAAETVFAVIKTCTHHDDVLLVRIGGAQDVAQVVKISRVAHGDQHVSGAHAHGAASKFLVAVDAELIEVFGASLALAGNPAFRVREDRKEEGAEG